MEKNEILPERGLVIRDPWVGRILDGNKKWELRGKPTKVRGEIALIRGGSCTVVGTARLVQCIGPLSQDDLAMAAKGGKIGIDESQAMDYPDTYAWVLTDVRRIPEPVPYRHPRGAITWVRLSAEPASRARSRRKGP